MLELDTKSVELDINLEQCSLSLVVRLITIPNLVETRVKLFHKFWICLGKVSIKKH